MFGAPRNGSCKTSRFDCRFVIWLHASTASDHQVERRGATTCREGFHPTAGLRPTAPLAIRRLARSTRASSSSSRHHKYDMIFSSFLVPIRMRIMHAKSAGSIHQRATVLVPVAFDRYLRDGRSCVSIVTIPIFFNDISHSLRAPRLASSSVAKALSSPYQSHALRV